MKTKIIEGVRSTSPDGQSVPGGTAYCATNHRDHVNWKTECWVTETVAGMTPPPSSMYESDQNN